MSLRDDPTEHTLAVIDQTLAGDPVAPADADLAELTLLLAAERPRPRETFAAALDATRRGSVREAGADGGAAMRRRRRSGLAGPRGCARAGGCSRPAWPDWPD